MSTEKHRKSFQRQCSHVFPDSLVSGEDMFKISEEAAEEIIVDLLVQEIRRKFPEEYEDADEGMLREYVRFTMIKKS